MYVNAFASLPDDANVWIYAFDEQLTSEQEILVKDILNGFIAEWQSHGSDVNGKYLIIEKQIVIIAGHCIDGISGCSIDSKVRIFKDLHDKHGLNALDGTRIIYRNSRQQIEVRERIKFRKLLLEGAINKKTIVFDLSARTLGELKASPIELPFSESWAYQAFASPALVDTIRQNNML